MDSGRLTIRQVVIVEGRYDKIKLSSILDAVILTTDGFGIFKDKEKQSLIRRLAETRGLITATDSDSAGMLIRNFIGGIVPKGRVIHLLIPPIPGRERRKSTPSKEGTLGVEGMEADLLRALFAPYAAAPGPSDGSARPENPPAPVSSDPLDPSGPSDPPAPSGAAGTPGNPAPEPIGRGDLYADGLMGGTGSSGRRVALMAALNLPRNLSTTALIDAINLLGGRTVYEAALSRIDGENE